MIAAPAKVERMVVRQFSSGTTHVADVSSNRLSYAQVLGAPCQVIVSAVKTVCHRTLNRHMVIVMTESKVTCSQCRDITGLDGIGPKYRYGKPRKTRSDAR